jgi:hypothetical protein
MTGISDEWVYLSNIFEPASAISNQSVVIDITYSGASAFIYLNAFSIGIGQNIFGSENIGITLSSISAIGGLYGVKTYEYGISENIGWYIGNNTSKKLYATNSSVPMVYGAKNCTRLIPNSSGPSLVLPGSGFLNEISKSQTISFEAWLRIDADGNTYTNPFRIFGPLGSSDGLYVNGQHLIVKVGKQFASHYVGEWFRPMLVNIEFTDKEVTLLVNGESVAKIDSDISSIAPYNNDYVGFYVGQGIKSIDIDCVAFYPYRIAPTVALRRFGYGQAVVLPAEIEKAYSGKQVHVDYTFAGYSSDYSYPKIESWKSSMAENVYRNRNIMGSPRPQMADFVLSDTLLNDTTDTSKWESDVYALNVSSPGTYPYIAMNPSTSWNNVSGYLYLNTLRQPQFSKVRSMYVVAETVSGYSDKDQVIFKIQNRESLDGIYAILSGTTLSYRYNIDGNQGTLGTKTVTIGNKIVVGLDFDTILAGLGNNKVDSSIQRFLKSVNRCSLFIGGDYAGSETEISTTFMGKIFKFGINTVTNHVEQGFGFTTGMANLNDSANFMSKKSSYELVVNKYIFNSTTIYKIETAARSYWKDYIPLSKFAKISLDENDNEIYVTDMLQFSVDVAMSKTYASGNIDSSANDVKTYVYFAPMSTILESMKSPVSPSTLTAVNLGSSMVIDASTSWFGKKFEVVDGTIILMPQSGFETGKSQLDYALVTVIEMKTKSTDNLPIKIRSLEYSAQTFNRQTSTLFDDTAAKKIGTRSQASSLYMYSQSGGVYNYYSANPVQISKKLTPYLYLTNYSGIKVLNSYGTTSDRGLHLDVNPDGIPKYKVSYVSMYIMINDSAMPTQMSVLEIYDREYSTIKMLVSKTVNDQIGKVSVIDGGTPIKDVEFYINGIYTSSPTLTAGQWTHIGMLFPVKPIDFSDSPEYKIEIVGSALINNLAYYQLRAEELDQQILPNEWNDYGEAPSQGDIFQYWNQFDTEKTWSELAASESFVRPELSPATINDVYNGTNRIIATSDNDYTGIQFGLYEYDIIKDTIWQNSVTVSP